MKPHKHAELIKAWADGAEIEYLNVDGEWQDAGSGVLFSPAWKPSTEYRIKPELKPDYDGFYVVGLNFQLDKVLNKQMAELKLTFRDHGMDMKLIDAEVLK